MNIQNNVPLAPYTSFNVGGNAEHFALLQNTSELIEALKCTLPETNLWTIGFGNNSLISDKGLSGMVMCVRGGDITIDGTTIVADSGAWWDDVVKTAIDNQLWGIELMSEVPGSVGAALFINITAYGQSVGKRVVWIDVWDRKKQEVVRLTQEDLSWGYKDSIFQKPENAHLIILRTCLQLSKSMIEDLEYQKALDIAEKLGLATSNLENRRKIIIEARGEAGSLWKPDEAHAHHTAGSFFRSPIVSKAQADLIMNFDESGKTVTEIAKMNKVHGGDEQRVSAAHVMLAAGFKRGQQWGQVKLNDKNLLKIEALEGATAQDIYNVMLIIQKTVLEKLGIKLEPEVRIMGEFTN